MGREGWRQARVRELGDLVTGATPDTKQPAFWDGSIPFVTPGDLGMARVVTSARRTVSEEGLARIRSLPSGSVLVTCIGATIGKLGVSGTRLATNQQINAIIPNDGVDADYLYYSLHGRARELLGLAGTTAVPILSKNKFAEVSVAIPPLDEQRRIAALLSAVDETIEATHAILDQLQVVKQAMMAELLTRGLPNRHTRFKQTDIGEVPEAWEVLPLGSLIAKGPDNGIYKPQGDYGSGTPIVRIDAFSNEDVLDGTGLRRVRLTSDEIERYTLCPDDILVNRVNSLSHIAKTALVGSLTEPTVFESNMMRLAVNSERLRAGFAFRVISSSAAKTYFTAHAKQAVAQASINQGDVCGLPMPIPPVFEQEEIVGLAESVEARIASERALLHGKERLKAALMTALLTGGFGVIPDEDAA